LVFKDVEIINHALMPQEHLLKMIELYGSIDMDDVVFIALANFVDGLLWTGDKQLINGLNKKGFLKTISTDELFVSFLKIELQKR
jgi:predicted nucleic acid-binding protein